MRVVGGGRAAPRARELRTNATECDRNADALAPDRALARQVRGPRRGTPRCSRRQSRPVPFALRRLRARSHRRPVATTTTARASDRDGGGPLARSPLRPASAAAASAAGAVLRRSRSSWAGSPEPAASHLLGRVLRAVGQDGSRPAWRSRPGGRRRASTFVCARSTPPATLLTCSASRSSFSVTATKIGSLRIDEDVVPLRDLSDELLHVHRRPLPSGDELDLVEELPLHHRDALLREEVELGARPRLRERHPLVEHAFRSRPNVCSFCFGSRKIAAMRSRCALVDLHLLEGPCRRPRWGRRTR